MKKTALFAAAIVSAATLTTAASAVNLLTVTYTGSVLGTNTTYGAPFDVPVVFTGVTTEDDAADGSFSYSSFTANYNGDITAYNGVSGSFVGSLFRISVGGTTLADFTFTGGMPNFGTGADYAVTLSGGGAMTGAYGTAVIDGGAGVLRGDLAVAGVPEPATWAMMMIGMGAIGYGLRSRRRSGPTMAITFG